jgi:hypothetical protein
MAFGGERIPGRGTGFSRTSTTSETGFSQEAVATYIADTILSQK